MFGFLWIGHWFVFGEEHGGDEDEEFRSKDGWEGGHGWEDLSNGVDGDSMHGVVEVAFGVPAGEDHGLRVSLVVGSAGPDFVIAFAGELESGCPTLPCVTVGREGEGCGMPTGAEVEANVHLLDAAGSTPGFAADFERDANGRAGASFGMGDYRLDGHERDDLHI